MIERSILERILHAGVRAPSGDNTQPWSFVIDGQTIVVRAHPEMDHPILNVEGRGTYIATGALLENIAIAAEEEGYAADIRLFEREGETARVVLTAGPARGHSRYHAIEKRHTNRGPYEPELGADVLTQLMVPAEDGCRIVLVSDAKQIRRIADASTLMEETALRSQDLHYLFFKSMIWRAQDNEEGKSGLYIKTTELPPPVQGLFRLIRYWPVMRLLFLLGLPKLAAKSNADVYASSGACVAILLENTDASDFIRAGRCMQRVWLEATHLGLAAQPLAGLIYLAEYVSRTEDANIEPSLRERILASRTAIHDIVGAGNSTIAMMLRVGVPRKAASARSRRRPPSIV